MNENRPLVSVIVAVLNEADTLERCIESVSCQTYPHRELIIMDGGSTDGSVDILRANSARITHWESRPDRGISHAWNKALDHATGEWIYCLGANDYLWQSDVLERMASHLTAAYPRFKVVYGKVALLNSRREFWMLRGKPWERINNHFLQLMRIWHQGVMVHRSLLEINGKFDESFRIAPDYELLLRHLKDNSALFVPDVLVAGFQMGGMSSRLENTHLVLKDFARANRKNGVKTIPYVRAWMWIKYFIKLWLTKLAGRRSAYLVTDLYHRLRGRPALWT